MVNIKKKTALVAAFIITATTLTNVKAYAVTSGMTGNERNALKQYQSNIDNTYNSFGDKKKTKVVNDYKNKVKKAQRFISRDTDENYGDYPTRSGVILVTRDSNTMGIHYGHAGIIWDASTTVESEPSGVERYPNTWKSRYNTIKGITVNSTTAEQDKEAADWCNNQVGKPYNWNFFNINTRDKFYCSQLVWAAYKDLYGMDIDPKKTIPSVIIPVDLPKQNTVDTIYAQWQAN
ncbi:hydrolase [Clostridium acetobutylicum]|nr:hydrolase [Clostridium acetobutylicum]